MSWSEAQRQCRLLGEDTNLASIRSKDDMDFIHMMLVDAYVRNNVTKTYIGLTLMENAYGGLQFVWSDGRPVSFTSWSVLENQPDGGNFEKCSLYNLERIHSIDNWHDVPCASAETDHFICMKPALFQTGMTFRFIDYNVDVDDVYVHCRIETLTVKVLKDFREDYN
ncbi:lectin BRA-3-like [Amphiura filiformis]|uniref:lectin BRA-3-like n=1 Tax=Amphiura filiformis TaxID=82378 RepID=UPI003B21C93B